MGASLGIKYLANFNQNKRVKGMVSIANPFDVFGAAQNANSIPNRIYGMFLAKKLAEKVTFNKEQIEKWSVLHRTPIDFPKITLSKSTFEIDRHFSLKVFHQFESSEKYYYRLSCFYEIAKVAEPVFFIQSKNDPISSFDE